MCRKFTGSLLPQTYGVPTANISPRLTDNAAFKVYKSSATGSRGFCRDCGSSLVFVEIGNTAETELHLGALDEEVLCGAKDEANAWTDESGRHVPRVGGLGKELCYTERHIFLENAIPGITDDLPGKQYLTDERGGEAFAGRLASSKE